jgi:hypothetical protein
MNCATVPPGTLVSADALQGYVADRSFLSQLPDRHGAIKETWRLVAIAENC